MSKILIGFGSKAKIGKDFAVTRLKARGFDVERIAFADELKKDLATLFKTNKLNFYEYMDDPKLKEEVRPLLCIYGQIMRAADPDVWVKRALGGRVLTHDITAITDVRFPNEVVALKEKGGIYIDIQAKVPCANDTERQNSAILYHMADYRVTNNFDETFELEVAALVTELLNKSGDTSLT